MPHWKRTHMHLSKCAHTCTHTRDSTHTYTYTEDTWIHTETHTHTELTKESSAYLALTAAMCSTKHMQMHIIPQPYSLMEKLRQVEHLEVLA